MSFEAVLVMLLLSIKNYLRRTFIRETLSTSFIPAIDGLRFVAITIVFLAHLSWYLEHKYNGIWQTFGSLSSQFLSHLMIQGHHGVQLFFAVSGFVLGLPFASALLVRSRSFPSLREYFLRRVTRLEPPYLLSLLLYFLALIALKGKEAQDLLPHLLASAAYLHGMVYGEASTINVVAWSLEVEVQFYLLAPFLAMIFFRGGKIQRRSILLITCGILILFQVTVLPSLPFSERFALSVLNHAQYFLVGFLIADWYVTDRKNCQMMKGEEVLFFTAFLFLLLLPKKAPLLTAWVLPVLCAVLLYGALQGKVAAKMLSFPIIVGIGGMCYSLYLFHGLIIASVTPVVEKVSLTSLFIPNFFLQVVLTSIPVILFCGGYFALIEKPCMSRTLFQQLRRKASSLLKGCN